MNCYTFEIETISGTISDHDEKTVGGVNKILKQHKVAQILKKPDKLTQFVTKIEMLKIMSFKRCFWSISK